MLGKRWYVESVRNLDSTFRISVPFVDEQAAQEWVNRVQHGNQMWHYHVRHYGPLTIRLARWVEKRLQ